MLHKRWKCIRRSAWVCLKWFLLSLHLCPTVCVCVSCGEWTIPLESAWSSWLELKDEVLHITGPNHGDGQQRRRGSVTTSSFDDGRGPNLSSTNSESSLQERGRQQTGACAAIQTLTLWLWAENSLQYISITGKRFLPGKMGSATAPPTEHRHVSTCGCGSIVLKPVGTRRGQIPSSEGGSRNREGV
ncbi:hypothetical protein JOB18_046462 [Solea senegalensis]|uniref:Secreted protein n=1 Tax=Solea senegalensis TaxID=28829 RepID=A0AAV6PI11_SOLSE|nr:hypothetical protein JOB18_046462 [Solea senegalensis]